MPLKSYFCSWILSILLLSGAAMAADCQSLPSWSQSACERVASIARDGTADLYLAGYAWHNRAEYSSEEIDGFNELAAGGGLGKSQYDADGDWHGLYAMAFLDSHGDVEPIAGYAFQKLARPSENTRLGIGYTVFLTSRSDTLNNWPVPGVLPLVSVGYRKVDLYGLYIPGGRGTGNVAFFFGKISF